MKKILFPLALAALPLLGQSQTIFQEDWDGNGPGMSAWTLLNLDGGQPLSLPIYNAAWIVLNYDGDEHYNVAASTSWYTPPVQANDWLISPQVTLSGIEHPNLVWQARAYSVAFPDGYKVMLATNGGNADTDFDVTLFSTSGESADWVERNIDLSAYAGQTIRFAFVNDSYDKDRLYIDNIKIQEGYTTPTPPACPVPVYPADNAQGIEAQKTINFSWQASAGAAQYQVYLDTVDGSTSVGYTSDTNINLPIPLFNTTYYWKVVAKNMFGESTGCTVYSFKTSDYPSLPYCYNFSKASASEYITNVNFAGIDNSTGGIKGWNNYTAQTATIKKGETKTLSVSIKADSKDYLTAFIDWNNNQSYEDPGEQYVLATDTNVTGAFSADITPPDDAATGQTRMRVILQYNAPGGVVAPCNTAGISWGEVEEYSVNVQDALAVSETAKTAIKTYPNPVTDVFNIESPYKVKSVSVFDVSGKKVAEFKPNAANPEINLSRLAPALYVVKVETENGNHTVKIIKK